MWRALVAGVVFGHASSASLLWELGLQSLPRRTLLRNADGGVAVRDEPCAHHDGIPTAWAFPQFLSNVVEL